MWKKKLLQYFITVTGTMIMAFGIYNIHARCAISEGGVLGLSLLLYRWFSLSPGIICFFLDVSCFLFGTVVLGKSFLRDSLFASIMYTLWYSLFEVIGPVLPDFSHQPLVAAILGGIFVGVGCGLVVRQDFAAGGDDALALSFHKLTGIKISVLYMIGDLTVLLLSLSYIPFMRIFYSIVTVILSSYIIELCRVKDYQ